MTTGLAFLESRERPDYGHRFSRLRWRRAVAADREAIVDPVEDANRAFAGAEVWALVLAPAAVPAGAFSFAAVPQGPPALARRLGTQDGSATSHTLRELESAGPARSAVPGEAPLVAFRLEGCSPRAGESVETFAARLAADPRAAPLEHFAALVADDPSERARPELIDRVPRGIRRLADVGCGAGATGAALRKNHPGLEVTGIERDAVAAGRARPRLDRVLSGDAGEVLSELGRSGERFDAFLFGDVLEHTGDPIAVLAAARSAASPGARLVVSVPNAGHLSVIRDLILGRFDPAPAGLLDAGHLRWFTRSFLAECLDEAGWRVDSIEAVEGAIAPDAPGFLQSLAGWPGLDAALLSVYQWIAVGTA
ncbi:MAG: methyltransferase domain-containing protein [Acidobacteriota bacterium]